MKKTGLALAVLMLAAGIGCNNSTPGGGGSHATNGSSGTADNKSGGLKGALGGPKDGEFTLKAPDTTAGVALKATTIKQGEQLKKDIGINRGNGFDEDVKLSFEGLPEGVTIDPPNPTLKHGEEKVQITLKAADNAALTESKVKIVGKPVKGDNTGATEWSVKVEKK